jgi:hypothetical protein
MALGFSLTENPLVHVHDMYSIGSQSIVTFNCTGKQKTVRAPLSGAFGLTVSSTWKGYFDGAGGGVDAVTLVNGIAQLSSGLSVTQPWFGRKSWQGTSPMQFDIPLRFLSRFDAYDEVYLPVVGLLSFLYPRLYDEAASPNEAEALSVYFIPGPSVFASQGEASDEGGVFGLGGSGGDPVEISIGSFMRFSGCYIRSVSLNIENSFNGDGYPHNVEAKVNFEAMDASFVNYNGSFMDKKLGNQAIRLNAELKDAAESANSLLSGLQTVLPILF